MANRFTYSKTIFTNEGSETFTAVECASFDEAKKFVDAGVRDREIELKAKYPGNTLAGIPSARVEDHLNDLHDDEDVSEGADIGLRPE